MSKNLIISAIVIIVIAAVGFAWWKMEPVANQKYAGPVETIRLVTSLSGPDLSSLIWIADAKGYFKDEGLNVLISQESTGVVAQEKVAVGEADMATDSDFGFVGDSFTLNNLRILASIDQSKAVDVVARRDRGINTPADLIGKKIGVTSGITPEFFFNQFIISNGILPSQLTIINMPIAELKDAIISGAVDAVSIIDPSSYNTKAALGANAISWSAQPDQAFSWFVISSDQFLKSHPEAAQRFIKSLLTAENFVKSNLIEAKQIIKNKLGEDLHYFSQNWPKHQFSLSLDQSSLINMENEARWVIAKGSASQTEVPNYINFIYFPAMEKVKPEAVTIIH